VWFYGKSVHVGLPAIMKGKGLLARIWLLERLVFIFSIFQVLHYLETLRPHQLLEQMVATAFKAAADTLSQTSYGELKQMETKIQQLYPTMASALRPLQGN